MVLNSRKLNIIKRGVKIKVREIELNKKPNPNIKIKTPLSIGFLM
jgi:hypothetical protein